MCSRSAGSRSGPPWRQLACFRASRVPLALAVDRTVPAVDRSVLAADLGLLTVDQVYEFVDLAVECLGRIIRLYLFGSFSTPTNFSFN